VREIPIVALVFSWVLPIVGGCLTVLVLQYLGLTSFWWMLLILPGALAFQWAVLLALMGVGKLLKTRPPKSDG